MKRLFYIFHDKLGENLFATPCLDFLSKEYELIVIMKEWMIPFFKDYSFISKIIPYEKMEMFNDIFIEKDSLYAYHNDKQERVLKKKYDNVKPYGVLSDYELNLFGPKCNSRLFISRTRQYILKLKLMSLAELNDFDCKIRVPYKTPVTASNSVIIYQGSRETSRRLPNSIIRDLFFSFPNAICLVDESTKSFADQYSLNYIVMDPITEKNYINIVNIFSSSPKCMIGPDSAFTQLALGYNIPQVWLQTRIKLEQVIDPQHRNICSVYSRKHLSCDKKCIGCSDYYNLNAGFFKINDSIVRHENLTCIKEKKFSCLEYDSNDLKNIINIVNNYL